LIALWKAEDCFVKFCRPFRRCIDFQLKFGSPSPLADRQPIKLVTRKSRRGLGYYSPKRRSGQTSMLRLCPRWLHLRAIGTMRCRRPLGCAASTMSIAPGTAGLPLQVAFFNQQRVIYRRKNVNWRTCSGAWRLELQAEAITVGKAIFDINRSLLCITTAN
jgi:hypothetical protein